MVAMTPREIQARRIRATRQAKGLTQADVADAIGVPQTRVSDWESGRRRVREEHWLTLADALDVEWCHLLYPATHEDEAA